MTFELLPTVDIMMDLYEKPRSIERFREYLSILEGDTKGDLAMPVSAFNPMAKEHVLQKLRELKELKAEELMAQVLLSLNAKWGKKDPGTHFKVALNLADDLKGGWTNRYTSDYDSKFKLGAMMNRKFCTPLFWTSESYNEDLIKQRSLEYVYRTIHWLDHPKPASLKEHIDQEKFVAENTEAKCLKSPSDFTKAQSFFIEHKDSDNYSIIFNFMYGDEACRSLGFPAYGVSGMTGYEYAKCLAGK